MANADILKFVLSEFVYPDAATPSYIFTKYLSDEIRSCLKGK